MANPSLAYQDRQRPSRTTPSITLDTTGASFAPRHRHGNGPMEWVAQPALPPDVNKERLKRINHDITLFFQSKQSSSSTTSPSLQGIGLYSHAERPNHEHLPRTAVDTVFVPLGGLRRNVLSKITTPGLHDSMRVAYDTLRVTLAGEEVASRDRISPYRRFRPLPGQEGPVACSADYDTDMGRADDFMIRGRGNAAVRAGQSNVDDSAAPALGSQQQSRPAEDVTMTGVTESVIPGNKYDATRDPRRRGR
ncbi:hypothetical protein B0J11DRAFT_511985 [Dendryphion nanum]|uniref:Uncharacterized protein n=1 Tax=Dendryphion nanum TaxID=256645 RepID=A0A9P9D3U3_9PLEO|nr:hypothetical protein B0J11DRAFT_511985 [Dendryphion nanum]